MSSVSFSPIFSTIPGALGGLINCGYHVYKKLSNSALLQVVSQIAHRQIPSLPSFVSAAKEAYDLIGLLRSESGAVVRKVTSKQSNQEQAIKSLKEAPNYEAWLQALTQSYIYCDIPNDTAVPRPQNSTVPDYTLFKTLQFPEGLKAMILVPSSSHGEPLIVFRGTDPSNLHNLMDDLNNEIGHINYSRFHNVLNAALEGLYLRYGKIHVTGHSYGGAVAQLFCAHFPQYFSRCTSFNSPGVGKNAVDRYQRNIQNLDNPPEVWSYRHAKDIVSLLGGTPLPASPHRNYTCSTAQDPISHTDAHSQNSLSMHLPISAGRVATSGLQKAADFVETCRTSLASIIPFYREWFRGKVAQELPVNLAPGGNQTFAQRQINEQPLNPLFNPQPQIEVIT